MVDVRAASVKEARVVGHDHARWIGLVSGEVFLQPCNVGMVQVICGLCKLRVEKDKY